MRRLYTYPVNGRWSHLIGTDIWEIVYKETRGRNWGIILFNPMVINFSLKLTPLS